SGYVGLYAAKGATLHRKSGTVFVYSMLLMSVLGMVLAVGLGKAPSVNIPAGLLTMSLIITSLNTVRPPSATARRLDIVAMMALLAVGLTMTTLGIRAVGNGKGASAFPYFMFGIVGLLAGAGDIRVLRSGPRTGGRRLARHLWRMSYALFIAS